MIKIVITVIVCAIITVYLKGINNEIAMLALIASGIIILLFSVNYISQIFVFFSDIYENTGLDNQYLRIVLKITAIGYIVEFGAGIVEDLGFKSLSDKLIFIGKLFIVTMSIPIIYSLISILSGLIQ